MAKGRGSYGKMGKCTCVLGRGDGRIRNNLFKRQIRFHCFPCLVISKCHSTAFRIKPKLLTMARHHLYRIWALVCPNLFPYHSPGAPWAFRSLQCTNFISTSGPLRLLYLLPRTLCRHVTGLFLLVRSPLKCHLLRDHNNQ